MGARVGKRIWISRRKNASFTEESLVLPLSPEHLTRVCSTRKSPAVRCHPMKKIVSAPLIKNSFIAGSRKWGMRPPIATTDPLTNPSQHDVIPIMLRHCTACHGRHRQEAGLDLRNRAAMLKGGRSGPAIVPGNADASLIVQKIHAGQMPPFERLVEASVKPVESTETAMLVKWIELGAPETVIEPDVATTTPDPLVSDQDREFWAFRTPVKPAVPDVHNPERIRNPVDAFVLSKLELHGASLAPEADRRTLIRRACFDLTGLPPDPQEIESFLSDDQPQAYERLD